MAVSKVRAGNRTHLFLIAGPFLQPNILFPNNFKASLIKACLNVLQVTDNRQDGRMEGRQRPKGGRRAVSSGCDAVTSQAGWG